MVCIGFFLMLASLISRLAGIDLDANAAVVAIRMLQIGFGMGTHAGSVLLAVLATSMITGIQEKSRVLGEVVSQPSVELAVGVPFISDTDREIALADAGMSAETTEAGLAEYMEARIAGMHGATRLKRR